MPKMLLLNLLLFTVMGLTTTMIRQAVLKLTVHQMSQIYYF